MRGKFPASSTLMFLVENRSNFIRWSASQVAMFKWIIFTSVVHCFSTSRLPDLAVYFVVVLYELHCFGSRAFSKMHHSCLRWKLDRGQLPIHFSGAGLGEVRTICVCLALSTNESRPYGGVFLVNPHWSACMRILRIMDYSLLTSVLSMLISGRFMSVEMNWSVCSVCKPSIYVLIF